MSTSRGRIVRQPLRTTWLLISVAVLSGACSSSPMERLSDCLRNATLEAKMNPTEPRDWRCESQDQVWVVAVSGPVTKDALVAGGFPEDWALWFEKSESNGNRNRLCVVKRLMTEAEVKAALNSRQSGEVTDSESICFDPEIPIPQLSVARGHAFDVLFKATHAGAALTAIEAAQ